MAFPTLLDIAKRNSSEVAVGLIDEAAQSHPEVMLGAARPVKGINYQTLVRTGVPTGNGFRNANEGNTPGVSTYINRLVECYIFNPQFQVDKAVADSSEDGAQAYLAEEAGGVMEGSMQDLASQFYYGTAQNAKGFPGLVSLVDSSMEATASGTGSDCSSIWAVWWNPRGLQWVLGSGGSFALSDPTIIQARDGNGKVYSAYWMDLLARIGLALHDSQAIGRIKNIEPDNKCTDDHIAALLQLFPTRVPRSELVLYMNRRSLGYLQASRTATNSTGAPAPFPTEAFGVPIQVTDAITDTETNS